MHRLLCDIYNNLKYMVCIILIAWIYVPKCDCHLLACTNIYIGTKTVHLGNWDMAVFSFYRKHALNSVNV